MKDKTETEQETEIVGTVRTVRSTTTKTPDGEYRVLSTQCRVQRTVEVTRSI